jgi:membrane dipeptidase
MAHIPPERFPEIADALSRRGWAAGDIAGVMGQNFLRVAEQTWLPTRQAQT